MDLMRNEAIKAYLLKRVPILESVCGDEICTMNLKEMSNLPFFLGVGTKLGLSREVLDEIETYIAGIPKEITGMGGEQCLIY